MNKFTMNNNYLVVALARLPLQQSAPALVRALAVVGPSSLLQHSASDQALNHILPAGQHSVKYDESYRGCCKYSQIDRDEPNCMLRPAFAVTATIVAYDGFAISVHLASSFEVVSLLRSCR